MAQSKRPVVIVGGWLSSPGDYRGLARTLAEPPYSRVVYITDVGRLEWGRIKDPDFRFVLDIVARTVELALRETGVDRVDIIGHSAGGRVARAYLGDDPFLGVVYDGQRYVASLTTLGTAHSPWEVFVRDFGAFVEDAYPGAYYPHIVYRSVAGESVRGRRFGSPEEMFAYRSYKVITGNGEDIGDGVSPTQSCYLPGADNIILRGVRHAPYNAPNQWYGADGVVEAWFGDRTIRMSDAETSVVTTAS
jgi:pimeloyl-ACP methyl ester carboxylesterase